MGSVAEVLATALVAAPVVSLVAWRLQRWADRRLEGQLTHDLDATLERFSRRLIFVKRCTPPGILLPTLKTSIRDDPEFAKPVEDALTAVRHDVLAEGAASGAVELRKLTVNTMANSIDAWFGVDHFVKAVAVCIAGSSYLCLTGSPSFGILFCVIELALISALAVGAIGFLARSPKVLIVCGGTLLIQVVLDAFTSSLNWDTGFGYGASGLWLLCLGFLTFGFCKHQRAAFWTGMVLGSIGFVVDAAASAASFPPIATHLGLNFVSNGVTWGNLGPFIGDLVLAAALFHRRNQFGGDPSTSPEVTRPPVVSPGPGLGVTTRNGELERLVGLPRAA